MGANILLLGHTGSAACLVHELSPSGAVIETDHWLIPQSFLIRLRGEIRMRHCNVLWRSGRTLGVRFGSSGMATSN
jgi:hypothetical protein